MVGTASLAPIWSEPLRVYPGAAPVLKSRINNINSKNCGNIRKTYLVTKALQILSHIHSIFYE